jgi:hypothetical protein
MHPFEPLEPKWLRSNQYKPFKKNHYKPLETLCNMMPTIMQHAANHSATLCNMVPTIMPTLCNQNDANHYAT